jgi:DNA polymerase
VQDFERDGYWRYRTRHGWTKLYSGKLVENVVQWLARIVMSQAMNRIVALGYRVVNCTHDELLVLIPDDAHAQENLERCRQEMIREPTWLPGIPLDAEASLGQRYSK